jgi:hypothetical protein
VVTRARKVNLAEQDSLGRNALIALVTGTLVASFVVLVPRLMGSIDSGEHDSAAASGTPAGRLIGIVEHASPQLPSPNGAAPDPTMPPPVEGGSDGDTVESVEVVVSLTPPQPVEGDEPPPEGDLPTWTINVTTGRPVEIDVFLEGVGPVPCGTGNHEVGEGATCTIEDRFQPTDQPAEVRGDAAAPDEGRTDAASPVIAVAP